jgi:hypothetical protein
MNDSLIGVAEIEQADPEFLAALTEGRNKSFTALGGRPVGSAGAGIDDVIHDPENEAGIGRTPSGGGESCENCRSGPFMQEDAVDLQKTLI